MKQFADLDLSGSPGPQFALHPLVFTTTLFTLHQNITLSKVKRRERAGRPEYLACLLTRTRGVWMSNGPSLKCRSPAYSKLARRIHKVGQIHHSLARRCELEVLFIPKKMWERIRLILGLSKRQTHVSEPLWGGSFGHRKGFSIIENEDTHSVLPRFDELCFVSESGRRRRQRPQKEKSQTASAASFAGPV